MRCALFSPSFFFFSFSSPEATGDSTEGNKQPSRRCCKTGELHSTFKRMNVSRGPRSILAAGVGGLLSSSHPPKQPPMYPTTRLRSLGEGGGGLGEAAASRRVRSYYVPGAAGASLSVPPATGGRLHLNKPLFFPPRSYSSMLSVSRRSCLNH